MKSKSIMKITFIATLLSFILSNLNGQIVYNFTAATGSGNPTNTSIGSVTQGNNNLATQTATISLSATTPVSSYSAASAGNYGAIAVKSGALATSTSTYIQSTVTAAAGYYVTVSNVSWGNFAVATNGPTTFSVYASNDNFTTSTLLGSITGTANSTWSILTPSVTSFVSNVAGTVTIRIYATGVTTQAAAGTVVWRVDDFKYNAVATQVVNTTTDLPSLQNRVAKFVNTAGKVGASQQIIDDGTNVGIGNSSPTQKLDVTGNVKFSGALMPNNVTGTAGNLLLSGGTSAPTWLANGTAGQVLTVNASGSPVWQPLPIAPAPAWALTGTAASATDFLGTTNAQDLRIRTNNTQAMVINASGNIGIGIASGLASGVKLEVNGHLALRDHNNKFWIGDGTNLTPVLGMTGPSGFIELGGQNNAGIIFKKDAAEKVRITEIGLGIATSATTVSHALHVARGSTTTPAALVKIDDGYQGNGKVLTSDANGIGTWQSLPNTPAAWNLGGNAGTTPGTDFIGTTDAKGLIFKIENKIAGRIDTEDFDPSLRNVSFGAQAMRDITTGGANSAFGNLALANNETGNYNMAIGFQSMTEKVTGDENTGLGYNTLFYSQGSFNTAIGSRALQNSGTGSSNVAIGYNAGNHGNSFYSFLSGNNNIAIGANTIIKHDQNNQLNIGNAIYGEGLSGNGAGKIMIGSNDFTKMGTNTFAVNGSALFTKATVKLFGNWPDYVFEKDYKLKPLTELEQFIQKNKHLPEVPNQKEIGENGIDLGANQAILLKKIEELTLYTIAADKKITDQQKQIEELQQSKILLEKLLKEIDDMKKKLGKKD